jgi:hypothetical protein
LLPGVYFSPWLLRTGVVVARELPRERSTLLVRLMAGGALLPQSIEELRALPAQSPERVAAEQILLNLRHVLGKKPSLAPEEREFMATMHDTWEKAREKGRDEGRKEGRTEEAARAVLTVLRARGLRVPKAARERILAQKDPEQLERWLKRAAIAGSTAEVFQEPN